MTTQPSIVIGTTLDERPCIVLAVGTESCTMTIAETGRLTQNLRALVRKVRRSCWKDDNHGLA